MTCFKAAEHLPPVHMDWKPGLGFHLVRVSACARTVRYEWPGVDDDGKSVTYFSPAFSATLQEWERAHEPEVS